jgi:hypothetical protein
VVQKALKVASLSNKLNLINNILQNLCKVGDKKLTIKWKHIIDGYVEECMKYSNMILNNNMQGRVKSG